MLDSAESTREQISRPRGKPASTERHVPSETAGWRPRWRDVGLTLVIGLAILVAAYAIAPPNATAGDLWSAVAGTTVSPAIAVGRPAPDFTLTRLDGKRFQLADYRGRPVWLNFFATWCPPCRAETPDIEATYRAERARNSDLVLLAVDMGEDPAIVRAYVKTTALTFPIGLDTNSVVAEKYRITGLPTHVFIDRSGIVRALYNGSLPRDAMERELEGIR